jgi:hypothetical protein
MTASLWKVPRALSVLVALSTTLVVLACGALGVIAASFESLSSCLCGWAGRWG